MAMENQAEKRAAPHECKEYAHLLSPKHGGDVYVCKECGRKITDMVVKPSARR